ncbi:MAG: prepilin-type N-terminal cleavage/methylation domain-containing protein [Candidatus Roizmanbacteria bacterium]
MVHTSYSSRNFRSGFTLIELILTMSIVLIIGSISGVFYSRFINQNAVSNISDQITEQMHKAQMYAMMGKNNSSWGVKLVGTSLTLFSSSSSAFDETFPVDPPVLVTGLTTVTFAKATGLPDSAPTINISGGGNDKVLVINSQGVINR